MKQLTKRVKYSRKTKSLQIKLKELFSMDRLYTIEDLVRLTGHKEPYVRSAVSMVQNRKYANPPTELVWKKCSDRIRRFGNPKATKICEVGGEKN